MRDLSALLGINRLRFLLALFAAVALSMLEALVHPLLVKSIFDAVIARNDFSWVVKLSIFYFLFGLILNIINFFMSLWHLRIENSIVDDVSVKLLNSFYDKDYRDILNNGSGHYLARIRSDVKDGLIPMLTSFRTIIVSIATFISLISVLIFLSLKAFFILAAIIPIATTVSVVVSRRIQKFTGAERDVEASLSDVLSRSVGSFKIVTSFGLQSTVVGIFGASVRAALDAGYERVKMVSLLRGSSDLVMVTADACSMFVGGFLVFMRQMTIGSFIAFMNAFWRAATTLMNIFKQLADFHSYSATSNRLVRFLHEGRSLPYHGVGITVHASGVTFSYGGEPVVDNFSMDLCPGERLLIVGDNGTGKSTLANILSGYLRPSSGKLLLPSQISTIVLPIVFPPIRVGSLPVDTDLLASFKLGSSELSESMPDQLSVGQQQKLALALALSRKADFYVLDEPLANLDTASRALAMENILTRTRSSILVMIMHDAASYVANFDKIITLDNLRTHPMTQVTETQVE